MTRYIYTLGCPVTNRVMYVGVSKSPNSRYDCHVSSGKKLYWDASNKHFWIKSLHNKSLLPILNIIGVADEQNWEDLEIFWIKYYRCLNPCLLNKAIGGRAGRRYERFKKIK